MRRAPLLILACASSIGGCLYPEYHVGRDGAAGTLGPGSGGAGGGSGGSTGTGGRGGATTGSGGDGGNVGSGSTGGAAGTAGSLGGSTAGVAGGTAGIGGGAAGRGGTTGGAGGTAGTGATGGGSGGRGGGTAGTGGGAGTTGVGGSSGGRGGGTAGTGGGTAGTGGGTAGAGGAAGSTPPPSWLASFTAVYLFDQPSPNLGAEAHGKANLHLGEEGGGTRYFPTLDTITAIQNASARMGGGGNEATFFSTATSAALPPEFATAPGTSFTMGGWFRFDDGVFPETPMLIHNDGPGDYEGGFMFFVDQQIGTVSSRTAYAYCRVGTSEVGFNFIEAESPPNLGPDPIVGGGWMHLVCRFDASSNQLSVFVAGALAARVTDTTHPIKSGPGPFMLGCPGGYCALIGNMDEVFFTRSALSDAAVARVYACGIDGSRCRCNGQGWASCGFAQPGCANLPTACDAGF